MSNQPYSALSFLIADDMPEFRTALRHTVEDYGAQRVDITRQGEEAIEALARHRYDVVFCDYNLGPEGKDGLQVLEEAHHRKILKHGQVFMMITAETSIHIVLGAIEHSPDGYLIKPFSKGMLKSRLDKILERKKSLSPILSALDAEDYDRAIQSYISQPYQDVSLQQDAARYAGQAYLAKKRYEEALKHYQSAWEKTQQAWAMQGIGKAYFYLHEIDKAMASFEQVIQKSRYHIEAYDWLSQCYSHKQDEVSAQRTLERAVNLSPKAILRQKRLGSIARNNGDTDVAIKAFRSAVDLGQHSVHQDIQDSLSFAESLIEKGQKDTSMMGKKAVNEASALLEKIMKQNPGDQQVAVHARMLRVETYKQLGQEREAEALLNKTYQEQRDREGSMPSAFYQKMLEKHLRDNNPEEARQTFRKWVLYHHHDRVSMRTADVFLSQMLDRHVDLSAEQIDAMNKDAVQKFKDGFLEEAIRLFETVATYIPNNISINLNLAQAYIQSAKALNDRVSISQADLYLRKVQNLSTSDKRYTRYRKLQDMLDDLKRQNPILS